MQKLLKNLLSAQLSAINLFAEKRLVLMAPNGSKGPETVEASPEKAEAPKNRLFSKLLDENSENGKNFETDYDQDPTVVAKKLAEGTNPEISYEKIFARLKEGYEKELKPQFPENDQKTFNEFWTEILTATTKKAPKRGPATKVSLEKVGGQWMFRFKDSKGEMMKFGAGDGVAINAVPPVTVPPAKKTPETEKSALGIREIDEAAEKAEQERIANEQKAQDQRSKVYGKKGASGGKLPEEHKKLSVYDLYPDSQKGDKISIKRSAMGTRVRAEFDGKKWVYVEGENAKDTVKIYSKDDVRWTPSPDRKRGTQPPKELNDKKTMGYFRVKSNISWEDIARTVMCTGKTPNGEEFKTKTTKDAKPDKNSAQAILEEKGYDPSNAEDVKKVAKILKSVNGSDKLNVWIVLPTENNPRIADEKRAAEQKKQKVEAGKRQGKEVVATSDLEYGTYRRLYKTVIENEDIGVSDKIADIVSDTKLWNFYWDGKFEGKAPIMKGLQLLGVNENHAREVIENAIDQGDNDVIDFEDLLDAFENKGIVVYKSYKGSTNDYDHFYEEWVYQNIAVKVSKNIDAGNAAGTGIKPDDYEWFEDNKNDFEPGLPDNARGTRKAEMEQIMRGCALVLDGVTKLDSEISVDTAEQMMDAEEEENEREEEAREEAAEQGRKYERPSTMPTPEEIYLQKLFHPQEAQTLEDIAGTSYDKASGVYGWTYDEDNRSMFRQEVCDAMAYREIKYNASVNGHLDRNLMVNELNTYIRQALIDFNSLPAKITDLPKDEQQDTEKAQEKLAAMLEHKQMLAQKYGIPPQYMTPQPDFMDSMLQYYSVDNRLLPKGSPLDDQVGRLVQDGFVSTIKGAEGKVERAETLKDWVNYQELLNQSKHPGTREVLQAVLAQNPDPKPTEAEIKQAVQQLDDQFEQPLNLFDINAGVNTNTGKFDIGLSKTVVEIGGFKLKVGFAINTATGEPIIGVMGGQNIPLTEEWAAEIQGGVGVAVPSLTLGAGARGGFRWTSKGSPSSSMRETVGFGGGIGTSMGLNLTDIYLGPHIYVEAGQRQDLENQYKLSMEESLKETGFARVEATKNDIEKATAIRSLPNGVGMFLIEAQQNLKWTDKELINYYERHLKDTLQHVTQSYVVEESSVVSEWAIGGTVDPIKLTLMAAAAAMGPGPLLAVTVAMYARIGFVIGNKIEVKRELSHKMSDKQREREAEMIQYIESRYPGIDIEVSAETLDPSAELISNNFAGDQLQRMIGKEQPAKMQMEAFNPQETAKFNELQQEFSRHHLKLTVDPETKMYAIQPTEAETFKVLVDSQMRNQNVILKGNKILISTTAGLNQLHIKRFDAFYPGTVDGAVQHTFIAITDNPYRTIGQMSEYSDSIGNSIESKYDRKHDKNGNLTFAGPIGVGQQPNLMTFEQYSALSPERRAAFATSETAPPESLARQQQNEMLKANIAQSDKALDLPIRLGENIELKDLPMSPDKFLQKYKILFRQLSTNATPESLKKIDDLIKKENPKISTDQLILYKEKLFQKSMSEDQNKNREATIKNRIEWAEKQIYTPLFKKQLDATKAKGETIPEHITAESLARQFSSDLKQYLTNKPQELQGGESIFTAVGTFDVEGTRTVPATTGQNRELNQFVAGFDYGKYLSSQGSTLTESQHWIGKILLEEHSKIPTENTEFLQCRLAKKLFYMGKKGEVPNPLIDLIGSDSFEQLIGAYSAIEKGESPNFNEAGLKTAIEKFRGIINQVREAQLDGIPLTIDNRPAMGLRIGNYYLVIETMLMNGIYEFCKNPSTLYNEAIHIFRGPTINEALARGSVTSGAADVTTIATRTQSSMSFGLTGVATHTFEAGGEKKPQETPKTQAPSAGPKGETDGESGSTLPDLEKTPTIDRGDRMVSPGQNTPTGGAGEAT